ncbi:coiled-coil-helix-coiled-coil-helix domain-containing protein 7-like [Octodon degus]|uniref:Coiled-coil-helix-coiled-coil-helix domain-containing protein 7 n=1 Tax=Octodon degus TaxID=10160 RepID=A0A6P3FNR2_OCTDE|nr:coiled-coil-helix-coiled-coil-helix domain-containing protein 7-like [Octodon degus]
MLKTKTGPRRLRSPLVTKQLRDPDINLCLSQFDTSTRCMDENNYNRETCSSCLLKYNNFQRFRNSILVKRTQNGVKPIMPTAAERAEILGAMGKMPY